MNAAAPARWRRLVAASVLAAGATAAAAEPDALDAFNVDLAKTSVSGVSSGGYMANQFHVAYSSIVVGAGILAAGPFYCAKGNVATALTDCTTPTIANPPDVGYSVRATQDYASRAEIDATAYLLDSKVWLFSGSLDLTVYPIVVDRSPARSSARRSAAGAARPIRSARRCRC